MSNLQTALQLVPNAEDFCTVTYAAGVLHRDERTVRRWLADGILTRYEPRKAPGEDRHTMLWVRDVTELRDALARSGRLKAST